MAECRARVKANCRYHGAVNKFVSFMTVKKTGAAPKLVASTLTELNQEGKALPAPNKKDLKTWIETERFQTQYDPALTDAERKEQLARLSEASKQTEGVTGGRFHAWKNVLARVQEKVAPRALATGLAGVMVVSMSGCFSNADGGFESPIKETGSNSQTIDRNDPLFVAPEGKDKALPGYFQSEAEIISGYSVKEDVDDGLGTYQRIQLDQDSKGFDVSKIDYSQVAGSANYSVEDVNDGYRFALNFVAEEYLDSTSLDNASSYPAWLQNEGNKYYSQDIVASSDAQSNQQNIIASQASPTLPMPSMVRDGKPRIEQLGVAGNNLGTFPGNNDELLLTYDIDYAAKYRVSDENIIAHYVQTNQFASKDAFLSQLDDASRASLTNGKDDNFFILQGRASLAVKKIDNEWKILGLQGNNVTSVR